MVRYLNGFDVDTDELARAFRRLADGFDDGAVNLKDVSTDHYAGIDDPSEFGFSITYVATHDYADVVDIIRYATKGYLRYVDEFIPGVIDGSHRVTLRYQLERDFEVGETVNLVDTYDDKFGETTIEGVFEMPIRDIPKYGLGYEDVGRVVEEMRRLYDEPSIDADTVVTVILQGDVDPVDGYDLSKLDGGD